MSDWPVDSSELSSHLPIFLCPRFCLWAPSRLNRIICQVFCRVLKLSERIKWGASIKATCEIIQFKNNPDTSLNFIFELDFSVLIGNYFFGWCKRHHIFDIEIFRPRRLQIFDIFFEFANESLCFFFLFIQSWSDIDRLLWFSVGTYINTDWVTRDRMSNENDPDSLGFDKPVECQNPRDRYFLKNPKTCSFRVLPFLTHFR